MSDRVNCCTCGRFIGSGASWAMIYSGYPPEPDHEIYQCAECNGKYGVLTSPYLHSHGLVPDEETGR